MFRMESNERMRRRMRRFNRRNACVDACVDASTTMRRSGLWYFLNFRVQTDPPSERVSNMIIPE